MAAAEASAYVEVELDNGRVVVGNVCQEQERKLIVYSPSGTVEINRAHVRRVEEHPGNVPVDVSAPSVPQVTSSPSTGYAVIPKRPSRASITEERDPKLRDENVVRELIFLYRDRAMATNNKDREAVEAINRQIEELEAQRTTPVPHSDPDETSSGDQTAAK